MSAVQLRLWAPSKPPITLIPRRNPRLPPQRLWVQECHRTAGPGRCCRPPRAAVNDEQTDPLPAPAQPAEGEGAHDVRVVVLHDGVRGVGWYLDCMSNPTYLSLVSASAKPLVWFKSEIKTPPLSPAARIVAGGLLRRLQNGETLRPSGGAAPEGVRRHLRKGGLHRAPAAWAHCGRCHASRHGRGVRHSDCEEGTTAGEGCGRECPRHRPLIGCGPASGNLRAAAATTRTPGQIRDCSG